MIKVNNIKDHVMYEPLWIHIYDRVLIQNWKPEVAYKRFKSDMDVFEKLYKYFGSKE